MINLYNEDCLITMNKMIKEGRKVQLIITDPPYGVSFSNDFYDDSEDMVFELAPKWLKGMYDILEEGGHCYIFVPTIYIHKWIILSEEAGFKFKNIITTKCKFNNPSKNNFKLNQQFVLFLHKGKGRHFNKVDFQPTSSDWLNDKRNKNPQQYTYQYTSNFSELGIFGTHLSKLSHPNQKSEDLIRLFIKLSSNEGEIVFDGFSGSGSTVISSVKENRRFIGCEMDLKHFNKITEKLNKMLK